jgi:hypothetical protein
MQYGYLNCRLIVIASIILKRDAHA